MSGCNHSGREHRESPEVTNKDSALKHRDQLGEDGKMRRIRQRRQRAVSEVVGVRQSAARSQEGNSFSLEVNINLEG